jgi:anti-sigma-K factor RskA
VSGSTPINIGGLPSDPAGRDALAGEFVLGILDARTAARILVAMQADPLWRAAVEDWELRLGPLGALARPEAPPPDTWDRIETRIAPRTSPRVRRERRLSWVWRFWAVGSTLAAAGLAAFTFAPRPAPERVMTVMVADRNEPSLLAEVGPRGSLRFNVIPAASGRQLQAPSGRSLQVWGLAPGQTAPSSLVVLPHEPGRLVTIRAPAVIPVVDTLIEISVEPEGGSPSGRPTGPIVYFGRLSLAGPDS